LVSESGVTVLAATGTGFAMDTHESESIIASGTGVVVGLDFAVLDIGETGCV
jgi:hypothetical protein